MSKESPSLDNIKVTVDGTPSEYDEKESKTLSLKVTTWMKLYHNLETSDYRSKFRYITTNIAKTFRGDKVFVSEHGTFAAKFALSVPYHWFLTTVGKAKETHNQPFSVAFHEIIDYTEGEIVDSLHINFMAEMLWLATEYMLAAQVPKMTVLCGIWVDPHYKFEIPFDMDFVEVKYSHFGCHHSKISILKYNDNKVRILISSANLCCIDWQVRSEGFWISPILPPLPETAEASDGESPTNFKRDFIEYLSQYQQPEVFGWEALIHRTDCSAINVFFIASVPGYHEGLNLNSWGFRRVGDILSQHATLPPDSQNWVLVAQTSSVGVFGQDYQSWLLSNIVQSMAREKDKKIIFLPEFKFIYPSQKNHKGSYDEEVDNNCLMFDEKTYMKQRWLKEYLYQWKSDEKGRSLSMPHMKCYTRISPDLSKIAWFVLTSSNLSKGAWGKLLKNGSCLAINNHEAGVIFIPQFIINQTTFPVKESSTSAAPIFLIPYDLPLTPYEPDDEPFLIIETEEAVVESEKPNETLDFSKFDLGTSQIHPSSFVDSNSGTSEKLKESAMELEQIDKPHNGIELNNDTSDLNVNMDYKNQVD